MKRPFVYLRCTSCGAEIVQGSRHKVIALSEGERDHWGSTTWSADRTDYLCDDCYRRVFEALADEIEDARHDGKPYGDYELYRWHRRIREALGVES